jgi:hypothetical protein
MHVVLAAWRDAGAGSKELRRAESDAGRQSAFFQRALVAVQIGQDFVQQTCALNQPRFDLPPFRGRDDERKKIERPGPVRAVAVVLGNERDLVVAQRAGQAIGCGAAFFVRLGGEESQQRFPGRPYRSVGVEKLVEFLRVRLVMPQQLESGHLACDIRISRHSGASWCDAVV